MTADSGLGLQHESGRPLGERASPWAGGISISRSRGEAVSLASGQGSNVFSLAAVLVALASNLENLAVGFSLGIGARRIGLLPNAIAIGAWTLVDPLLPAARTAGPWRLSKIYEAGDASPPALLRATVDVSGEAFVDLAAEVRMAIARD